MNEKVTNENSGQFMAPGSPEHELSDDIIEPVYAGMVQQNIPLTGRTLQEYECVRDLNTQMIGLLMMIHKKSNKFSLCRLYLNDGFITACLSEDVLKECQMDPTVSGYTMESIVRSSAGSIAGRVLLFTSALLCCRDDFSFPVSMDCTVQVWPNTQRSYESMF